MTSFISPILDENGSFRGMAGMDVSLQSLDEQIRQIKVLKTGYAFLVSNGGTFVSYPDNKMIGTLTLIQLAQKTGNDSFLNLADAVMKGKEGYIETIDPVLEKPAVLFYTPIQTGTWSLVVVAPVDEILSDLGNLRDISLGTGVLAVIILFVCVVNVSVVITRSITQLKTAALQIADGDLGGTTLKITSQDELGQMAGAFNSMVVSLGETACNLIRIAEGDLTVTVKPKSEKDVMGQAFVKMIENLRMYVDMLATEKELLNTTLMSISDGVIVIDEEGLIILFNHTAEEITGYAAAEALDQPIEKIVKILNLDMGTKTSDILNILYKMNKDQKENINYQSPMLLNKSGKKILIEGSISAIRSMAGGVKRICNRLSRCYRKTGKRDAIGSFSENGINWPTRFWNCP